MRKLNKVVLEAIQKAGGRPFVAKKFDISPEAVRQWAFPDRGIPAKYVLEVEAMSGVSRHEISPQVFGKSA